MHYYNIGMLSRGEDLVFNKKRQYCRERVMRIVVVVGRPVGRYYVLG